MAGVTSRRSNHVMADIRQMLEALGKRLPDFSGHLPDGYGRPQPVFNLPKREALILVSGYSVEMRARIIDRRRKLESYCCRVEGWWQSTWSASHQRWRPLTRAGLQLPEKG